jgi:hypothetical protein
MYVRYNMLYRTVSNTPKFMLKYELLVLSIEWLYGLRNANIAFYEERKPKNAI